MKINNTSFLSIEDLKNTIQEFKSLNFEIDAIADAEILLRKIIKGFHVFPIEWYDGTLYRARKHSKKTRCAKSPAAQSLPTLS